MRLPATRTVRHAKRISRLYVEHDLSGSTLALDEREAHYLGHVLRLQRDDRLVVFNGRGTERDARVQTLSRRFAELELGAALDPLPEPALGIVLVQAIAKADAMDLIVQKATELGVRLILPAYTAHGVVRLDAARAERRVEHWLRIAQSACEQCGRHRPPDIAPPEPLERALARVPHDYLKLTLALGAPARFDELPEPVAGVALVVGPEGGFSDADWAALDAGDCRPVALGPRVLRAETAAIAACVAVQTRWGDL
jgi:16S rRNA (uracil1498-N3)-methyltransferase